MVEKCMSCDRPAKAVVLVKSSEALVGNGMARWEEYWLCQLLHRAEHLIPQVRQADPDASIIGFVLKDELLEAMYQVEVAEIARTRP